MFHGEGRVKQLPVIVRRKFQVLILALSPFIFGCVAYQKVPLHDLRLNSYAIEREGGNQAEMLEIRAATTHDIEMYGGN